MELPINYETSHFTVRKLAREAYVQLQGGCCCHCKAPLSGQPSAGVSSKKVNKRLFPKSFFKWPVHLHHNRSTGLTIGAVHGYCNAVLWQYYGE